MGCRIKPISDDKCVSDGSLSKALLFTTMCIVGLPVEVHIKDGSVYSGIFHTACFDDGYGVVLKKANMIKKGENDSNVSNGACIETLLIGSGDLVQVVAKEVLFPSDGAVGNVADDSVEPVDCTIPVPEKQAKTTKSSKTSLDRKHFNQTRRSAQNENGYANGLTETLHEKVLKEGKLAPSIMSRRRDDTHAAKTEEISTIPVNGRQAKDHVSQCGQNVHKEKSMPNETETVHDVQSSKSSLDRCVKQVKPSEEINAKTTASTMSVEGSCDNTASLVFQPVNLSCERPTSAGTPPIDAISSGASAGAINARSSVPNKISKEFKLNPAAKVFSPSSVNNPQPPIVTSTAANMNYIPNNSPVVQVAVTQADNYMSSFAPRTSPPAKIDPYSNLTTGNGYQYSQPIVGCAGGRTQPVRYTGQYHHMQTGPTYVHPNSESVAGRTGQIFYVHPVSHDVIHGAAAISPASARPVLTPHQIQYPKHQGTQAPQALQIYVPPHLLVGGPQPILMPSQIPLLQSPFIVNRSIPVSGSIGVYGTKFP